MIRPVKAPEFDCQACGACCTARVELEPGDAERVPPALVDRLGCMRTSVAHRCIALRGTLGEPGISCSIYSERPAICRRVQVGDPMCLFARNMYGLAGGKCLDVVLDDVLRAFRRKP